MIWLMINQTESMSGTGPTSRSHLILSLRALAIASAIVALASLTVLVVVASIKEVDTLSTVALAVAIVAFVVQIIVSSFRAQSLVRRWCRIKSCMERCDLC
jgi:ribose 5-phosphate isomerase